MTRRSGGHEHPCPALAGRTPSAAGRRFARKLSVHSGRSRIRRGPCPLRAQNGPDPRDPRTSDRRGRHHPHRRADGSRETATRCSQPGKAARVRVNHTESPSRADPEDPGQGRAGGPDRHRQVLPRLPQQGIGAAQVGHELGAGLLHGAARPGLGLPLQGGFAGPGRLGLMPRGRRIGRPGGLERQGCGVSPGTVMSVSFDLPAVT